METFALEFGEHLKDLDTGEAVHFTYEQLSTNPDQEVLLLAQLTKHLFDTKPNEDQIRSALRTGALRLANLLTSQRPILTELSEGKRDQESFNLIKTKVQELTDTIHRYQKASNPLEIYSIATFGKAIDDYGGEATT